MGSISGKQVRTSLACAALVVTVTLGLEAAPSQATPDGARTATFTLSALSSGLVRETKSGQVPGTNEGTFRIVERNGITGVSDLSLADQGASAAMSTVSKMGVDLSWRSTAGVESFVVERDGIRIAKTPNNSFRDSAHLQPGRHDYKIVPLLPSENLDAVTWGLQVYVPRSYAEPTGTQLAEIAQPMAARSGTSVVYDTFIPQKYIAAPPTGCTYSGSKYVYGGDDRGFQASGYPYRTSLSGRISWSNGGSLSTKKKIGATHVYKKSNHALVAQKTASASNSSLRKLAGGNSSAVTLRFSLSAGNPFCQKFPNAIQAAFTMHITRAGSWSITSGSHTQMPNHEVAVGDGRWTMAYKRSYANLYCLVNFVCERANMTGYTGSYS